MGLAGPVDLVRWSMMRIPTSPSICWVWHKEWVFGRSSQTGTQEKCSLWSTFRTTWRYISAKFLLCTVPVTMITFKFSNCRNENFNANSLFSQCGYCSCSHLFLLVEFQLCPLPRGCDAAYEGTWFCHPIAFYNGQVHCHVIVYRCFEIQLAFLTWKMWWLIITCSRLTAADDNF